MLQRGTGTRERATKCLNVGGLCQEAAPHAQVVVGWMMEGHTWLLYAHSSLQIIMITCYEKLNSNQGMPKTNSLFTLFALLTL